MLNPTCLLIDDSEEIHFVIKKTLIDICEVSSAFTFAEARRQFELKNFDIIIIDLILKEHNGMDLLKEFKESKGALKKTRFFIMTGKDSRVDEAMGHNLGVDEYIKKPFDRDVFKAIVRKNLKLIQDDVPQIINDNLFYIAPHSHQAFVGEIPDKRVEVPLTVKEFKLLVKLISHPEKIFSREELYAQVWNLDSNSTYRTIDMHVSSLRKKLKDYGNLIKTVHQIGYKYSKS
jgi:two-component system alkaline phosphatase synthesis response regulator PhoP